MSEEKKTKKLAFLDNLNFIKKIKQVKHIGLIVVIIFILILLVILFGDVGFGGYNAGKNTVNTSTYSSYYRYAEILENKLKNVLGKIKGAGNIEVMVTVHYDNEGDIKNLSSQTNQNILIGDQNDTDKTNDILPSVTGVVIVSSGAVNTVVKLNLLTATQTLLNIEQNKIQIFVGN